jgi:RimJ/RimL family protein N-acetyltransferase
MTENGDLKSGRVKLVDFAVDDLEVYREWFLESDPERQTCRPLGDLSLKRMMDRFHEGFKTDTAGDFAVRRLDDSRFVGRVTYFDLNIRNRSAEIGFLIGPVFRRQGYARESVILLLDHLFNKLDLNKVMAQTGEFNAAAISLLKKLSFKQDGRLRCHHPLGDTYYDALIFSLLSEEFKAV